jgi:hypothetical protein
MAASPRATLFYTRGVVNATSANTQNGGITEDTVTGQSEIASTVLANGSQTFFQPPSYLLTSIGFDASLQTYYFVAASNAGATVIDNIYSGSTVSGTANGTSLHSSLTANEISVTNGSSGDVYFGFINDIVDDPLNHKIYFTQQVTFSGSFNDYGFSTVTSSNADTGLFSMNENGTGVTKIATSALSDPTALSLDLADGLIFFGDSTGDSYVGQSSGTAVNNLDVYNINTGTTTTILSEPWGTDAFYGAYGGRIISGVAVDAVNHVLYFTTNNALSTVNSANGSSNAGIYKISFSINGNTVSFGSTTTLYSGANAFNPSNIVLDVANNTFYVTGGTATADPNSPGDYITVNQGVFAGSTNATNIAPLTQISATSETTGSPAVTNGETVQDVAIDVAATLVAGATVTWETGLSPLAVDSALTATAGSSPSFNSATAVIGNARTGDTLAATVTGTSITASFNTSTFTLTLSGVDTVTHYQQVLDSITYTSSASDPTSGGTATSRTLTYTAYDGIMNSIAVTSTINVRVNATVTAGATATFTGGGSPVAVGSGLTISDVSSSTLVGATIAITNGRLSGDILNYTAQNGINGSFNTSTGVLTLNGTATLAQYQAAIASITFSVSPSNADPTNGSASTSRTIAYTVTDGIANSSVVTSAITVVHAAPTITAGATPTYTTGGPAVAIDSTLTLTAPDSSGLISSATVTIATNRVTGDILNFVNQNGISGVYSTSSGVLTLSGSATAAQYQAAIDSITFSATSIASTATRGITYVVNDGTASSATSTSTVTVQHPAITIGGTSAGQAVNDTGTISPFGTVTLTDSAGLQDSATITLTVGGTASDADGLLSGTGLTKTGTGTYSLAAATPAALQASLRALIFTPTANQVAPGSTVTTGFTLGITDTGAGSASNTTTTVVATSITDTPSITGTVANQATTDLVAVTPFAGVTISDPDVGVTPTITITLRSGGVATDANGILSGTGLTKTGTGTYTLTDTPANLTSQLRALSFTPTPDQVAVGQVASTEFDLLVAINSVTASDMTTSVNATDVPCYCQGTLILTERGEVAVEDLAIGDQVMTLDGTVQPIRWLGRRSYGHRFARRSPHAWPVLIQAGALGPHIPQRDLAVSPEHAIYLDGALVPARHLVNGRSIVTGAPAGDVHYHHVELDAHAVIFANGAPAETFIDDNSRQIFHNAAEFRALYPDDTSEIRPFCAPRLDEGYALAAIRDRLDQRAAQQQARRRA